MTIVHHVSSSAAGRLLALTLFFGGIGFVSGFLLSLVAAAYSLYSCSAVF